MNHLEEYKQGLENHLKQCKLDQTQKRQVRDFYQRLHAGGGCNMPPKDIFVEKMGRLQKQGRVQITKTPEGIEKHGANYLAIFDHKLIVGSEARKVSKVSTFLNR